MATAVSSSPTTDTNPQRDLAKHMRSHEVAIAELTTLPSSRPNFQDIRTRSSLKGLIEWWRNMESFQPLAKKHVEKAGFGPFLDSLWNEQCDRQALLALSELWWDTTNTFHFSFGEMTLTPKDFTMITGLSIKGKCLKFYENANSDEDYLLSLLGMEVEVIKKAVRRTWLFNNFAKQEESKGASPECITRAFLLYMISCTFFAGTDDMAYLGLLASMEDVSKIRKFNWGGAALATMYQSMSDMSRGVTKDFGGLTFIWEIWYYEYLNLCRPSLAEETMEWPILRNYAPSYIAFQAANRHDYAHARAFLASLAVDMVEWDPWRIWVPMLPKRCIPSLELTSKRVLLEGPKGRYWYLGERVLRQVKGDMSATMTPMPPPMSMRHANSLEGDELVEALRGWDAEEFTSHNIEYNTFCQQFLMKPRVTGLLPQGSQRARGHSSSVGSSTWVTQEEDDMEEDRPQPLPQPNWFVDLCSEMDFVKTPITHPAFDESPKIDPGREQVPTAYAQEYIDLSEGLRRDLVRMSLANTILEARLRDLSPVYQKNGNIFFRTTVSKAIASEQRQLDMAKAKLQKPNST